MFTNLCKLLHGMVDDEENGLPFVVRDLMVCFRNAYAPDIVIEELTTEPRFARVPPWRITNPPEARHAARASRWTTTQPPSAATSGTVACSDRRRELRRPS